MMSSIFRMSRRVAVLASAAVLAACGGGGSDSSGGDSAAAGFYSGTAGSGANQVDIAVVVLDTGRIYSLYFDGGGDFAGVVIGNGSTSGNQFNAGTVRDFSLQDNDVTQGSLTSTFVSKTSITGNLSVPGTTVPFSATYDSSYESTPSLGAIAGTYGIAVLATDGNDSGQMTISSTGALSGATDSGCNVTGTVGLHAKGNVYDVRVTFGTGCGYTAGTVFNGHAVYDTGALLAIIPNGALTEGFLLVGFKS